MGLAGAIWAPCAQGTVLVKDKGMVEMEMEMEIRVVLKRRRFMFAFAI